MLIPYNYCEMTKLVPDGQIIELTETNLVLVESGYIIK